MLPDRGSPDRSREAGLNDKALNCTGVRSYRDLVEHVDGIVRHTVVKGNCVLWPRTRKCPYGQFWSAL